jgi:hypothetical protein
VAHELSELVAAVVAPRCSALASAARAREGNGEKLGVSRRAWRPGVCVLAAASTRVGHAARTSCARSATVEAEFKILNSETKLERSD